MIAQLAAKLVALMLVLVPLREHGAHPPDYEAIAFDIATVAMLEGNGDDDAMTLARIAARESHYSARVDSCAQSGDGGKAWGLFQVHSRRACLNRLESASEALRRIHASRAACGNLSQYETGRCK